jgi:cobyrinic acid a,c-diamide synthase
MYLTEAIVDQESHAFPMVGVFPTCVRMQPQLAALGYAEVAGMTNAGWLRTGEQARGHEFRYSVIDEMPERIGRRYRVSTMAGERQEGYAIGSVLASYVHLHFGSCPRFAARFVAACAGN